MGTVGGGFGRGGPPPAVVGRGFGLLKSGPAEVIGVRGLFARETSRSPFVGWGGDGGLDWVWLSVRG